MLEICDDIVDVLDADGDTDEVLQLTSVICTSLDAQVPYLRHAAADLLLIAELLVCGAIAN